MPSLLIESTDSMIIVGRDGRARQYIVLAGVPRFCRRERAFVHIIHAPLVPCIEIPIRSFCNSVIKFLMIMLLPQ